MTTLYVVMINDRHCDPEAHVFATADTAIAAARQVALNNAHSPSRIEEYETEGWLWHASYSVEGDSVWVIEKTLNEVKP